MSQPLQHHSLGTAALASTTTLHALPIDGDQFVKISDTAHSVWIATIDSDIANIQLEEFRKVFAGGIVSADDDMPSASHD